MAFQDRLKKKNKGESESDKAAQELKEEAQKRVLQIANDQKTSIPHKQRDFTIEHPITDMELILQNANDQKTSINPNIKVENNNGHSEILQIEKILATYGRDISRLSTRIDEMEEKKDYYKDTTASEQADILERLNRIEQSRNIANISQIVQPSIINEDEFLKWAMSINPIDYPSVPSIKWIQKYKRRSDVMYIIRLINLYMGKKP